MTLSSIKNLIIELSSWGNLMKDYLHVYAALIPLCKNALEVLKKTRRQPFTSILRDIEDCLKNKKGLLKVTALLSYLEFYQLNAMKLQSDHWKSLIELANKYKSNIHQKIFIEKDVLISELQTYFLPRYAAIEFFVTNDNGPIIYR